MWVQRGYNSRLWLKTRTRKRNGTKQNAKKLFPKFSVLEHLYRLGTLQCHCFRIPAIMFEDIHWQMHINERIIIDPAICHGKPVVEGTRMPVSFILGSLAGGMSYADMKREYDLTEEDIRAAMAYAAEMVEEERHVALRAGQ